MLANTVSNTEVAELIEDSVQVLLDKGWGKGKLYNGRDGDKHTFCARGALLEARKNVTGKYGYDFRDETYKAADQAFAQHILEADLLNGVNLLGMPAVVWCNSGPVNNAGVHYNNLVAKTREEVIDELMATAKELRNA